jgi:hypothetical protein
MVDSGEPKTMRAVGQSAFSISALWRMARKDLKSRVSQRIEVISRTAVDYKGDFTRC